MRAFTRFTAVIAGLAAVGGAQAAAKVDGGERQQVAIRFALTAGDQPVECGRDIAGLGTGGQPAQLHDARFYIAAPALIDAAGHEVPIELEQNDWQYANLALLDFENKTGKCVGSADINDTIKGSAPRGRYKGFSFVIGVPSVVQDKDGKDVILNHSNFATAPAPLDLQSMTWNWQAGRKFIKIEVDPDGGVTRPPPPAKNPAIAASGPGAPPATRLTARRRWRTRRRRRRCASTRMGRSPSRPGCCTSVRRAVAATRRKAKSPPAPIQIAFP